MELTGADIFVQSLKEEGVDYIFGYPGGAVLHIYDALYQQTDVQHVLVRHEQAATHAADGYARSTGKPGVVMVTSGPVPPMLLPGSPPLIWIPFRWWCSPVRYPPT